jgi:hypothetical protein
MSTSLSPADAAHADAVPPDAWPLLPVETDIYILPDGRVIVADLPGKNWRRGWRISATSNLVRLPTMTALIPLLDSSSQKRPQILQLYQNLELFSEGSRRRTACLCWAMASMSTGRPRAHLLIVDPPADAPERFQARGGGRRTLHRRAARKPRCRKWNCCPAAWRICALATIFGCLRAAGGRSRVPAGGGSAPERRLRQRRAAAAHRARVGRRRRTGDAAAAGAADQAG